MIYLIVTIVILSIWDIKDLIKRSKKKEIYVYVIFMILVGAFGIFYYINPERDSLSKILLSLIGQEG